MHSIISKVMMRSGLIKTTFSLTFFLLLILTSLACSTDKEKSLEKSLEKSPSDGLGAAFVIPAEDVKAGSSHTWEITYTAAAVGIVPGGGVVFHISPFWHWTPPQNISPERPGFVTVYCSDKSKKLDITINSRNNYVVVRLKEQPLKPGEQITLIYGDTQGKFKNAKSNSDIYAENNEKFFIKVDGDGDGFFASIKIHPKINILSNPAKRFKVTAPSYIEPGKFFVVTTAGLDNADNWDKSFKQKIKLDSFPEGISCNEIPADNDARLFQCITEKEGSYFLSAKNDAGTINGESNPIVSTKKSSALNLYWGDLHGHSNLSDGTGTPDNYYNYARFAAGLDVAVLTDHDAWGFDRLEDHPEIWSFIKKRGKAHNKPGEFVTFSGYEYTNWTSGHMHVIFKNDPAPLFSSSNPAYSTPDKLWEALKGHTAITVPHHTGGGPIATDWNYYNSEFMPVVEICSIHGNSESIDVPECIYRPVEGSFVRDALARGYKLGIIASGDTHNGHPGMGDPSAPTGGIIAFYAKDLTKDSIWDALKKRYVYGTSGKRIILDFKINGRHMGEIIKLGKQTSKKIEINITGTDRLKLVEVIKNNKSLKKYSWTDPSFSVSFTDNSITAPNDFYYLRVEQQDNHMAWSSPIWIK